MILSSGQTLHAPLEELKLLAEFHTTGIEPAFQKPATLHDNEREHILKALAETRWRVGGPKGAASMLGLNRSTLRSRMQKLGICRGSGF
ncbi:MAG: helix-turn-helix domain-containing protein [Verrucomicrobiota bacterium]